MTRRSFSTLRTKEAFDLVPVQNLNRWDLIVPERPPSDVLLAVLERLHSFSLTTSEAAKVMLIDIILTEIVPHYPNLKVWKGEPLESGTIGGVTDYLIAPRRAYVETPLLCAIEAKRDDFEAGEVQCIGGYPDVVGVMAVCQQNNLRDGHETEVYGIVSNGQVWVFYRLTRTPEVFVSGAFTTNDLPKLLGVLDHVCSACSANVPNG